MTGHTGFKGGWLAVWLRKLGAEGRGNGQLVAEQPALDIDTNPGLGQALLRQAHAVCAEGGAGGGLLIGVDRVKPRAVLEPAYDDALGVTAAFNLNLLRRMNRELGMDFDLERFRHYASYCPLQGVARSFLVSQARQTVRSALLRAVGSSTESKSVIAPNEGGQVRSMQRALLRAKRRTASLVRSATAPNQTRQAEGLAARKARAVGKAAGNVMDGEYRVVRKPALPHAH